MKLEQIGFYTLSDDRAKQVSVSSPLWRCELILTDKCNFSCPYCRGVKDTYQGCMSFQNACDVIDIWTSEGLKNVRFSGGEPTLWEGLDELVYKTKSQGVQRIALSTNGSAEYSYYEKLIEAGVDDFSISLDACCASTGDLMAGGVSGAWKRVTKNIALLSKKTYVTVGVVITQTNEQEAADIIKMASEKLGVSDIRVISAAQRGQRNRGLANILSDDILQKHPILNYRFNNVCGGRGVRGLEETDSHKCPLVLDDMAVLSGYHFPCIIYLREGGDPIGRIDKSVRTQRYEWFKNTDVFKDKICRGNCLDVCVDYNKKVMDKNISIQTL